MSSSTSPNAIGYDWEKRINSGMLLVQQAFALMLEGDEKREENTEDYVGRYVNMLVMVMFMFGNSHCSIVTRYYTETKFPDLVL